MPESNNNLVELTDKDINPEGLHERIDSLTEKMLAMPQVEAPVIHRFAPGLYIREVNLPAGAFVVGHEHKTEHFNIMLKGHLIMVNEDGSVTDFIAPQSYVAQPGLKVVYIVEDTVWQNIFPSNETDIDKLEELLLIKDENFKLNEEMQEAATRVEHDADRFSYSYMKNDLGFTEDYLRALTEDESDQIPMPGPVHPYRLSKSLIEGTGYFLTVKAESGAILAPSRIGDKRTPAGRYVNHSGNPNSEMRPCSNGNLYLVAIKDIDGCIGGNIGTEVTIDYKKTISLLSKNNGEKLCQQ